MKRRSLAASVAVAAAATGALHFATRARSPDGWDAIGFARAVRDFDLAAFQPHFPGYPVYVALIKLARSPPLISAIASAATAAALWRLAARYAGARAGWVALALWAGAFQPWLAGGAALADATATALVAAAFAALTWPGAPAAFAAAAVMALALGTRLSYWPLALSFAVVISRWRAADRRAALVGGVLATLLWLAPFIGVVGAGKLIALGRVQVAGHFTDWGGSVATRPELLARTFAFARAWLYDGIWPNPIILAVALAGCALLWQRPPRRARALGTVVVVPYALWALLAQNVVEQPRHLLPLVAATIVAIAVAAARRPLVGAALVALAFAAAAPLLWQRPPPAAAVVAARAAAMYPARGDVVVFARRSARVMAAAAPTLPVRGADRVSDILGTLERLDLLPRHVLYVAEELPLDEDQRAHSAPADERLHVCRDARLDRQSPCVTLRSYALYP